MLALLKRHGWNSTSFQVLEPGFRYWFDGDDACIAYVEAGRAFVVAGAPIAPPERFAELARSFGEHAREARRRVCWFATEARFRERVHWPAFRIGEQPSWRPALWPAALAGNAGLRSQLRRARAKGVRVRQLEPSEFADEHDPARRGIERLIERWQGSRRVAPMAFLVQVEPFAFPEERRCFVAERAGAIVGFLAAVPVYARSGWLLQHFLRDPEAPNGTVELLIDSAMRAAAEEEARYVTLGLAPLSGDLPAWLRLARRCGGGLYDFDGLRLFKARLAPQRWDPIYLSHSPRTPGMLAALDALNAFARGSLLRFGADTLRHRLARG